MAATATAAFEWATSAAGATAGAEAATGAAAAGGVAETAGVMGATAASGAGAGYAGVAAGSGLGGLGGAVADFAGSTLGKAVITAGTGALVSSALTPKPPTLSAAKPLPQPDPLGQEEARRKSFAEQLARRGRAASVLTDDSGSQRLGG